MLKLVILCLYVIVCTGRTVLSRLKRQSSSYTPVLHPTEGEGQWGPIKLPANSNPALPHYGFTSNFGFGMDMDTFGNYEGFKGTMTFPVVTEGRYFPYNVDTDFTVKEDDIGFTYGHNIQPSNALKLPIDEILPCVLLPHLCAIPARPITRDEFATKERKRRREVKELAEACRDRPEICQAAVVRLRKQKEPKFKNPFDINNFMIPELI